MNVSFMRLKPILRELKSIRSSIDRLCDLKALELQHVHGLVTDTAPAKKSDLADTQVSYVYPGFEEIVTKLERQSGRKLDPEEVETVLAAYEAESEED
jgi:hypothetical protein